MLLTVTVEVIAAIIFSVAQTSWIKVHGAGMTVIVEVTFVDGVGGAAGVEDLGVEPVRVGSYWCT